MATQRVGTSAHFAYEYDDALGNDGRTLAQALMASCEYDLNRLIANFPYQKIAGRDTFTESPVIVVISGQLRDI